MKFWKLISFLVIPVFCFAQEVRFDISALGSGHISVIADVFENVYAYSDTQLMKYSISGDKVYAYRNNRLGKIGNVDCSIAFKTMLYFSESNQIVLLDNKGGEMGQSINLNELGIYGTVSACHGHDGSIWLLNADSQNLIQLSTAGVKLFQSTNLEKYLPFSENGNQQIYFTGKNLTIYAPDLHALSIFSNDGAFLRTIHLNENDHFLNFHYSGAMLCDSSSLKHFNGATLQTQTISPLRGSQKPISCTKNTCLFLEKGILRKVNLAGK